jgi:transcriptional regulator with XRE-family HTH domain
MPEPPRTRFDREALRRALELRRAVAFQIRQLREDAGVSQAALARAAGISAAELSRIEAALVAAPQDTLVRIGLGLGGDVRFQFVPGAGVPIRDRYQARIIEALLPQVHRRWKRVLEVVVQRPVRGVVDFVLHDPDEPVAVASEVQSLIKRVEQQLRWHSLKADGLRAGSELPIGEAPVSRLLVLRDTPANDRLVETFRETFRTHYPADPVVALRALTTSTTPWPGPALIWARVDGSDVAIRPHPRRRRVTD